MSCHFMEQFDDNTLFACCVFCHPGKGKTKKEAKPEPTNEELHAQAVNILKEVDFNTVCKPDLYVYLEVCLVFTGGFLTSYFVGAGNSI